MYPQPSLPLAYGGVPSSSAAFSPETEPGSIEDALLQLVQDHHNNSIKLRERTDREKKDAIKKAARAAELMVEAVNGGVQEAFVNEKRIEHEIRALAATITRFTKQTDHWLSVTNSINSAIKEIGDFENWMKIMEFDCKSITAAIHNIHQP
ncbi:PREDICTED: biogenesis of lysosome-related organelles complex 1 subunit 1 [Fragaria vesca subsp. vesca]|uniref:biogenesis of lysosome-related organelles complex 1 subunit 1 n=1 Tax=Fragaria vesca subsp. vesca TaxID=101020 RepID=UPI0002C36B15|nr:PREDICTED: biogenesis of lysosome-related organelles complex 1 subunit 1 [Fragaria vesca subsp. vesca]